MKLPEIPYLEWDNLVNRSAWVKGEWDNEVDRIQWWDEDSGYYCLIVRHLNFGYWGGYVGIPKSNSLYKCSISQLQYLPRICIHGGITYLGYGTDHVYIQIGCFKMFKTLWWFGFDCGHTNDHVPWRPSSNVMFLPCYKSEAYAVSRTEWLASQLERFEHVEEEALK